eukprot:7357420-Pyramimonas_sp.AAC.1
MREGHAVAAGSGIARTCQVQERTSSVTALGSARARKGWESVEAPCEKRGAKLEPNIVGHS